MSNHYVYMLANKKDGVLYIGVTTDLRKRVWQHKNKQVEGFTSRYNIKNLVWYEPHDDYWEAAQRERRMKKWKRDWKINLIEEANPEWDDLYASL